MTEATYVQTKKINLNWIPEIFFHPRKAFQYITSQSTSTWLTPLIVFTVIVLVNIVITGQLKSQAASLGEITYPPDFQNYTPEQQAQYMQATQSTQSPVFVYVLPGLISVIGIWFAWLIMGGALHLITTLFGGRGSTMLSMNIVAWASLPLALRHVVQIIFMLATKNLITNPGLSGFTPAGDSTRTVILGVFFKLIDIYLIWQIMLIYLGVRTSTGLSKSKAAFSAVIPVLLILLLQTGLLYLLTLLGNLNITRPFFF